MVHADAPAAVAAPAQRGGSLLDTVAITPRRELAGFVKLYPDAVLPVAGACAPKGHYYLLNKLTHRL